MRSRTRSVAGDIFWGALISVYIVYIGIKGLTAGDSYPEFPLMLIRVAFLFAHPVAILFWIGRRLRPKTRSRWSLTLLISGLVGFGFTVAFFIQLTS